MLTLKRNDILLYDIARLCCGSIPGISKKWLAFMIIEGEGGTNITIRTFNDFSVRARFEELPRGLSFGQFHLELVGEEHVLLSRSFRCYNAPGALIVVDANAKDKAAASWKMLDTPGQCTRCGIKQFVYAGFDAAEFRLQDVRYCEICKEIPVDRA